MLALRAQLVYARGATNFLRRHSTSCACAAALVPGLSQPEPGSVVEYHQHVMIKLAPPTDVPAESLQGSWWPKFVEKDPCILEAFKAIAKHQSAVDSLVKITAYDDVGSRMPLAPGTCDLMAFPQGVRYRGLPLARLGEAVLHAVADDPSILPSLPREVQQLQEEVSEVVLLVCCHGARDSRCGAVGPPLAAKLRSLVRQKGLEDRIKTYKTSHVGGHKYAGNVLVLGGMHPCDGDWYGGVNAENASEFLEALVNVEIGMDGGAEDAMLRRWWRGRMGLSKEEQLELFEAGGGIETLSSIGDSEGEEKEGLTEEEELLDQFLEGYGQGAQGSKRPGGGAGG